jgi:hypothetical protein
LRALLIVIASLLLLGVVSMHREELTRVFEALRARLFPCDYPITYSIGAFDKRFGLSKADFAKAISDAERIWEAPLGKNLFEASASGTLTINLIYDERQAATNNLQKLGIVIDDNEASYQSLKTRYASAVSAYDRQKAAYEATVAAVNKRGGARPDEYQQLQTERAALNAQVSTINDMVTVLNRLAASLNLSATQYNNTVHATLGGEFQEGNYQGNWLGGTIDIYQFDNRAKLERVLAHELGHALELDHVDDPAAIMYRLNDGKNEKLTATDLQALRTLCRVR